MSPDQTPLEVSVVEMRTRFPTVTPLSIRNTGLRPGRQWFTFDSLANELTSPSLSLIQMGGSSLSSLCPRTSEAMCGQAFKEGI